MTKYRKSGLLVTGAMMSAISAAALFASMPSAYADASMSSSDNGWGWYWDANSSDSGSGASSGDQDSSGDGGIQGDDEDAPVSSECGEDIVHSRC